MAKFAEVAAEFKRMCKSIPKCAECPLSDSAIHANCLTPHDPNEAERIIMKWAEGHPIETRQTKFEKAFPNCIRTGDGVPSICAQDVYGRREIGGCLGSCKKCWNTPISDTGSGKNHDT